MKSFSAGTALLLKDNLGDAYPMGFGNKGKYYYNISPGGGTASINPRLLRHVVFHGPARLLGHRRIDDRLHLANRIRR